MAADQAWFSKALSLFKDREIALSTLAFCDLRECIPPGSSLHGVFQARILEWVAISFSRGSSRLRNLLHWQAGSPLAPPGQWTLGLEAGWGMAVV